MLTRRKFLLAGSAVGLTLAAGWRLALAADKTAIPVLLYKSPGCKCCDSYAAYLRYNGFKVTVKEATDLASISGKAGIPAGLQGCHTAFIGDYVVDGHVPVEAVQKLLGEHPDLKGLTLPGMPAGSPGMSGTKEGPFIVYGIDRQGQKNIFMTV